MTISNFPKDIPYHLFSTCILVNGCNRSCIYDLQRGDFDYIPNSLFEILNNTKNITFEKLLNSYDNQEDKENLAEYFNFLYENEYIFFSKLDNSLFPALPIKFNRPYRISTLVIDIDNTDLESLQIIKENIINSKVECLVIRIINSDYENILSTLSTFDGIPTRIIQLFISKNVAIDNSQIDNILEVNNRTSLIIKSTDDEEYQKDFLKGHFISTNRDIINNRIGIKDVSDFAINMDLYIESKLHNSFYNKRTYINSNGDIFRHEYDEKCFGNIADVEIRDILNNEEFKEYWNIKKDEIEVCQNCEYRYMCTDNRLPIKKTNNLWGFDKECNYNPYTSTWEKNDILLERI